MKEETTLPRPFGDYLLVAQLGDDPLGSVYRALHSADEKRFVRLRILQSGELSPRAVLAAVTKLEALGPALAHDGIVRRPQFGVIGGVPYMAWYETAGWTLDRVLAMARAAKAPVSTEYALLLGERVIEATEAATRFLERDLTPHGVLWPGFVSISNDAEVRIAGFGLAPSVLPVLRKPRVSREVAPYVAPEARDRRRPLANSDVYSLGIMLLELLTGRRPALGAPLPEMRADDPFSQEIGTFLKIALAPPDERYPTIADMRRALQETMMAAPKLLYPAGLAFYLYKLLNPESNGVPQADADSTNPVQTEPRLVGATEMDSEAEPVRITRVLAPPAESEPEPLVLSPAEISAGVGESGHFSEAAAAEPERPESALSLPPVESEGPLTDPALLEAARRRRPIQAGGTGALLLLAGSVFGLALLIDNDRARRAAAPPKADPLPVSSAAPTDLPPSPLAGAENSTPPTPLVSEAAVIAVSLPRLPRPAPAETLADATARASSRIERREAESARRRAEDVRFQAGLARIAAERFEGAKTAAGTFRQASDLEREAEALYQRGQYAAARSAFRDAVRLYREAEKISHEERVRRVKLSSAP
jgi:serine/threonine protein kinase